MKNPNDGKLRKEIWLNKQTIKKLTAKAKADKRKLKPYMEISLEEIANKA